MQQKRACATEAGTELNSISTLVVPDLAWLLSEVSIMRRRQ